MSTSGYSHLSIRLTKEFKKDIKKKNGIYFTPPSTIHKNIHLLKPYMKSFKEVLEPSCGSCEYISQLHEKHNHLNITGIELNKEIFVSIQHLENNKIKLMNHDFLTFHEEKKYDLIIGNPPYFVLKKKDVDESYFTYFDGRPNIFIMFIIKSIHLIKDNGIISFVLPRNFLNCLYYDKTRRYIKQHFKIIHIEHCDDSYIETQQETILLIIQKTSTGKKQNDMYCWCFEHYTIFGFPQIVKKLISLTNESTTLKKMGFKVSVGNVVWNQHKKDLTDDPTKTLLIYSSDIKSNKLEIQKYKNAEKKNYILKDGSNEPLLVLNRGYGMGKYQFEYCLINENDNIKYLIENHLICIQYTQHVHKNKLIQTYKEIIDSFENKKTSEFVNLYFGNNAINTTELYEILPIYGVSK